jgi:hypothetical protein
MLRGEHRGGCFFGSRKGLLQIAQPTHTACCDRDDVLGCYLGTGVRGSRNISVIQRRHQIYWIVTMSTIIRRCASIGRWTFRSRPRNFANPPANSTSGPASSQIQNLHFDDACTRLFDVFCERRRIVQLAYLLRAWPLTSESSSSISGLLSALHELLRGHAESMETDETALLVLAITLAEHSGLPSDASSTIGIR